MGATLNNMAQLNQTVRTFQNLMSSLPTIVNASNQAMKNYAATTQNVGKSMLGAEIRARILVNVFMTIPKTIMASVDAYVKLENATLGLRTVLASQGKSFKEAEKFFNGYEETVNGTTTKVQGYLEDGLVSTADAYGTYKTLAATGFKTNEIEKLMNVMKDVAVFNKQSMYTTSTAQLSTAEGIKNDNSVKTDNIGITKNLSIMWKEYADKLGKGVKSLTQVEKRQAVLNGFMKEGAVFTGNAKLATQTLGGKLDMMSSQLFNLKAALGSVIAPLIIAFTPAIMTVMRVMTEWFNTMGRIVSAIFGIKKAQLTLGTYGAGAADGQNKLADGIDKAGKAAADNLQGFDELNTLQKPTGGSDVGTGAGVGAGIGEVTPDVTEEDSTGWVDDITKNMDPLINSFARLKDALKPLEGTIGQGLSDFWELTLKPLAAYAGTNTIPSIFDSISDALNKINFQPITKGLQELFPKIKEAGIAALDILKSGFEEGLGPIITWIGNDAAPKIIKTINEMLNVDWTPLKTSFANVFKSLGDKVPELGNVILGFAAKILEPLSKWTFGEGLPHFLQIIADFITGLNFSPLELALNSLAEAFVPFAINVGSGLLWAMENILKPLATWVINEALPRFLDTLSGALNFINTIIDIIKPNFQWFWDAILSPIASWTGGIIISVWDSFNKVLNEFSNWLKENPNLVNGLVLILGSLAGAIVIVAGAMEILSGVLTIASGVLWIVNSAAGIFAGIMAVITSPVFLVIAAIAALIAIGILLYKNWDTIKEYAGKLWDWIKNTFSVIWDWVAKTWDSAIQTISNFIKEKWDTIWGYIKPVYEWFSTILGPCWEIIKASWDIALEAIKIAFGTVWDAIKLVVLTVYNWFKDVLGVIWTVVKETWDKALDLIKIAVTKVWDFIKEPILNVYNWLRDTLSTVWEYVKTKLNDAWDGLGSIVSKIWDGIKNTIKDSVNTIIDLINTFVKAINKIQVSFPAIGNLPAKTIGFNVPEIPRLADGGIATSSTFANIGEGTYSEAVLPLGGSVMDSLGEVIANAIVGSGGMQSNKGGSSQPIIINVDGKQLARITYPYYEAEAKRSSTSIITTK